MDNKVKVKTYHLEMLGWLNCIFLVTIEAPRQARASTCAKCAAEQGPKFLGAHYFYISLLFIC